MVPDDFARLGELMRRGGVWKGRRLLSKRFVREAVTPVAQNGCYGYFIWVNASKPCVGPRVIDRPVRDERDFPTLPADMYQFAGLFGQLVTVFPSQGLIVARFGQDSGSLAGGAPWEEEFYRQVLGSITDEPIRMPKPKPNAGDVSREDVDRGFFEATQHPDQVGGGEFPPPLPPAGPARARATLIELRNRRPGPHHTVKVRLHCPRAWPSGLKPRCSGRSRLTGAGARHYRVRAGKAKVVRFHLRAGFLRRLDRKHKLEVTVKTHDRDRAQGAVAKRTLTLHRR
jgi:hypothetical protein